MKKVLLLTLCLIPLSISCNKGTSLGFDNPFPNDEYISKRIGFNLAEDEISVRPLTTAESDAVINTRSGSFDDYITSSKSVRHYRSYIRAFAGNFKQGYDAYNLMVDETNESFRQEYEKDDAPTYKKRTIYTKSSDNLFDYNYGQIGVHQDATTYRYLYEKKDGGGDEVDAYPAERSNLSIHDRIKTEENGKKTVTDISQYDQPSIGWPDFENLNKINEMQISQKQLLAQPDGSDCGADANGQVILVSKEQHPYNEQSEKEEDRGIFYLADGRKYRAVDRSITVAKAKVQKKSSVYASDWVLVQKARTYKETVITSDIIQPNVPITDLKEPIVITFEEVMYESFGVKKVTSYTEDLPVVTKPEQIL